MLPPAKQPPTQATAPGPCAPASCAHAAVRALEDGDLKCPRCGEVWVNLKAVQARNHKVARSVAQLLGTLIGGSKPPPTER